MCELPEAINTCSKESESEVLIQFVFLRTSVIFGDSNAMNQIK